MTLCAVHPWQILTDPDELRWYRPLGPTPSFASRHSQPPQPRRTSVVEDLLSNDGITFHPIQHGPDEE